LLANLIKDDNYANILKANELISQGKFDQAQELLMSDSSDAARYLLGKMFYDNNNIEDAKVQFSALKNNENANIQYYYNTAMGDFCRKNPESPDCGKTALGYYLQAGNYEKAADYVKDKVSVGDISEDELANRIRQEMLAELNKDEVFQKLDEEEKKDLLDQAISAKLVELSQSGKYSEETLLLASIDLDDNENNLLSTMNYYLEIGDLEKASHYKQLYENKLNERSTQTGFDARILNERVQSDRVMGDYYMANGDYDNAMKNYEKVLVFDPKNKDILANIRSLAKYHMDNYNLEEAKKYIEYLPEQEKTKMLKELEQQEQIANTQLKRIEENKGFRQLFC